MIFLYSLFCLSLAFAKTCVKSGFGLCLIKRGLLFTVVCDFFVLFVLFVVSFCKNLRKKWARVVFDKAKSAFYSRL